MRKVELKPLESNQPGHGQLVLLGWKGENEGLSLDIQRNQDEHFLQEDGLWRSNTFKFHLPTLQPGADESLTAVVDDTIVDPLLENPHATYMVRLYGPDGAQVGRARLRIGQGLMSSGASGTAPDYKASATLDTPQAPPANPEPQPEPVTVPDAASAIEAPATSHEAVPEPAPARPESAPAPAGKSKRWLWILLAVAILAAIIGAAAWFGLAMRGQEPLAAADETTVDETTVDESLVEGEATPQEEPLLEETGEENLSETAAPEEPAPTQAAATAGPCSLQRMEEMGELEFIHVCTSAGSEAGNMMAVIGEARDNAHCGIARRLYAHQAISGDVAAALAYAREFDPAQHAPSACFPVADTETAIFWYDLALSHDPDNAEASQRLEELQ
ncbi:hypothetical protein [Halomonas sp. KM-1]|uniref:hypothetical protein n=1 Tax=Halomonas sp. KM-1 TaxID=590061 RepID=UPI000289F745|nr:hypothetical protein [Halomonas sp. KM-1]